MENVIINGSNLIINGIVILISWLIKKAGWIKNGNVKIGGKKVRVWSWGTLFGCDMWDIPELGIKVKGTCGNHCSGCFNPENWKKSACYVAKSYYQHINKKNGNCSARYGHALRTLALRYCKDELYNHLRNQILKARFKPEIIRLNVSGEIECKKDFELFCKLAAEFTDIQFYIYSKNYGVIIPALLSGMVPKNFTVNVSIWHECGIAAYNLVKHLENVKAFIYDDRTFNYSAHGLDIQTYCPAYDEHGKMNHELTCDICKKCFNRFPGCKCIGCYDH